MKGYKQSPEHIAKRKRLGKEHHSWKGDNITEKGGRSRAQRMYPVIGNCKICNNKKSERHHIDGNTSNNEPSNIEIICRKCHMELDGRLARLIKLAKENGAFTCAIAREIKSMKKSHSK